MSDQGLDNAQFGYALDGVDGTGITVPSGASGIRGWLSGIYNASSVTLHNDALAIIAAINSTVDISGTVWVDATSSATPVYYVRRETIVETTGVVTVAFYTPGGTLVSLTAPQIANLQAITDSQRIQSNTLVYTATASGTGYSSGNILVNSFGIDTQVTTPTIVYNVWLNASTNAVLSAAPTGGTFTLASQPVTSPTLAQETGGNLAGINTKLLTGQGTTATSLAVTLPTTQVPTGYSLDGTDTTGVTQLAGGVGIRGWLSGIFSKLNLGPQSVVNSISVNQSQKTSITGITSTVSAVTNLLDPTGAASTDVRLYNSATITIVDASVTFSSVAFSTASNSTFTLGVINGVVAIDLATAPGIPTFTPSFISYGGSTRTFKVDLSSVNYLRVTSAGAAGITCTIDLNQEAVPNTLIASASSSVGTVNLVASNQLATLSPSITDLTAGINVTTTSGSFTPTWGVSHKFTLLVDSVAGTNPTLNVTVEERTNSNGTWNTIYTFPTITANAVYESPFLAITGNQYRYVQTVGGTTPSFSRSISRIQSNVQVSPINRVNRYGGVGLSASNFPIGAQRIRKINIRNANTVVIYQQFHNPTNGAALTNGAVPSTAETHAVAAVTGFLDLNHMDFGPNGESYGGNTVVALSTTANTYTALTAPQQALVNLNIVATVG